jgi:hypothetical protein
VTRDHLDLVVPGHESENASGINTPAYGLLFDRIPDDDDPLFAHVVALVADRDAYRRLAHMAIHALADVTRERDSFRARYHIEIEARRSATKAVA